MPTRFYLPSTAGAEVSPTYDPNNAWWTSGAAASHEAGPNRRNMRPTRGSSAITNLAFSADVADHLANDDSLFVQFIGPPMLPQSIAAQAVRLQIQASETHLNNNLFVAFELFVCSRDGSTIKETLMARTRDVTNELTTAITNRTVDGTTTLAEVEDGDRIVMNIGLGGTPGPAAGGVQGHNGTLRFGENGTSGDLPVDDTTTPSTFNPWLEFADEILFPQAWLSKFPELIFRRRTIEQEVSPFTLLDFAPPIPEFVPLFLPQRIGMPPQPLQGMFAFLPDLAPPIPDFIQTFVSLPRSVQRAMLADGIAFVPLIEVVQEAPEEPVAPTYFGFGITSQGPPRMVGY